ncbi:MAM and LDL-receptor class A domain-containing 2-like [Paramuricea clavata]|uniref:MAM and LDL-receptor class A domain-containing 2-like n=1 Tax=Paramuricea clavata TaxID=317549 RepID=A0A6S7FKS2_PARCT|nr:MAM and LDL-receptor class A domain-containing 2-like [Paramuricea clavata]
MAISFAQAAGNVAANCARKRSILKYKFSCNFEDPNSCRWTQDPGDDFDWTRNQGYARSYFSGPITDHTKGLGKCYILSADTITCTIITIIHHHLPSLNAKHNITIAELDLEITIFTASLHKEQEKVVSHSVRIAEIEKQIQNFIADNNRQTVQTVHGKVAINMSSPEYKLPTNNADKSNQIEGVTLNLQKFRVGSNISVVDLGHLVNSESLNNYSNISNTKENTLLNNLNYEDNECIVIDNSTILHEAQ